MRLGLTFAAALAALPALAQDVTFEGETIDVVVPFGPGGATYVSAKFLEPYFEKHLPGNPDINVVDRPGGGSILGANWFEQNAEADGTTILFTTSSTANPFVLGQEEVEYRLGDYRVAYTHPFSSVAYVAPSLGVEEAAGIEDASQPLIYGGIAAAASDLPALLSFEVLGLDVRSVLGFDGRGPVRLAFERGEVNIDYQFTPVYLTQVVPSIEEGQAVPLWTGGAVGPDGQLTQPDPIAPDLPPVYEVHRILTGEPPFGHRVGGVQRRGLGDLRLRPDRLHAPRHAAGGARRLRAGGGGDQLRPRVPERERGGDGRCPPLGRPRDGDRGQDRAEPLGRGASVPPRPAGREVRGELLSLARRARAGA